VKEIFNKILGLIKAGEVLISEHGYDELIEDKLSIRELLDGAVNGQLLKNIQITPKGHVYYFYSRIDRAILFMLYGAFRKNMANPLFWLRLTDQIRNAGIKIFYGDEKNEASEKNQVYS